MKIHRATVKFSLELMQFTGIKIILVGHNLSSYEI